MSIHRPHQWKSNALARGRRFVIVASRFNPTLTRALAAAAKKTLIQAGASPADIGVKWVSGAFELPVAASRAAKSYPRPDGVIALGVLIRGETAQYAVIAHAVAQGLMRVSLDSGIPVSFGVIVAETTAQAKARSGGKLGNRGAEAAEAALSVLRASSPGAKKQ